MPPDAGGNDNGLPGANGCVGATGDNDDVNGNGRTGDNNDNDGDAMTMPVRIMNDVINDINSNKIIIIANKEE